MSKLKAVIRGVRKGSPYILTGAAVIGIGTTAVLAVKATPKAMESLREATDKKQKETGDPNARLTKGEAVKVAGKHYIPAGVSGLITAGCAIGSTVMLGKRATGAAVVATAAQTALSEYSDKVAEKFGKEKETEIHDEIAVNKMKQNLPKSEGCVIKTGYGDQLFYFIPHHVWFRSNIEIIRRQLNDFNAELILSDGKSENEFLDLLYHGDDIHGETYGFPPPEDKGRNKRSTVELRFTSYKDESGYPDPEYSPSYILDGEAATAIDYAPWSYPVTQWDCG